MAIVIHCKSCGKRSSGALDQCPHCQSTDLRFIAAYRPHGRYGRLIRQPLPESVTSAQNAHEIATLIAKSRKKKTEVAPIRPRGTTVKDLFPLYLDKWSELYHRPSTHDDIFNVYHASFVKIIGHLNVEDTDDMSLYIEMRKAEGVTNRTINKEMDYYSGFRKWCRKKYQIPAPVERTERLPYKRPLPQILSIKEVVQIWDAAEPFYQAFFGGLFTVGLRIDEVRQIQRKDIDFKNRLIRVIQKGGSYKILPLNDWFLQSLRKIGVHKMQPDDYIFLNCRTGKPIQRITKALQRACKTAGIKKHVTPHLFRHSVATFLMGKNINMSLIQKYMGHAKINTTEWYTHVAIENLREAGKTIQSEYEAVRTAQKKSLITKNKSHKAFVHAKKLKAL